MRPNPTSGAGAGAALAFFFGDARFGDGFGALCVDEGALSSVTGIRCILYYGLSIPGIFSRLEIGGV
jgi:hypothetical protein